MKIDEVVSGKDDNEEINIGGMRVPVSSLKGLIKDGYEYMQPYKTEKTLSLWGKTRTGCFTRDQIISRP